MRVDVRGQRRGIILVVNVPVVRPGELGIDDALGGLRHALESLVVGIGQDRR